MLGYIITLLPLKPFRVSKTTLHLCAYMSQSSLKQHKFLCICATFAFILAEDANTCITFHPKKCVGFVQQLISEKNLRHPVWNWRVKVGFGVSTARCNAVKRSLLHLKFVWVCTITSLQRLLFDDRPDWSCYDMHTLCVGCCDAWWIRIL